MSHIDEQMKEFDDKPHVFIQWKGTDVCADLYCPCGAHLHYDGDFMYYVQCPHCEQYWKIGSHVRMYPVTKEDAGEFVKRPEPDEQMADAYDVYTPEGMSEDDAVSALLALGPTQVQMRPTCMRIVATPAIAARITTAIRGAVVNGPMEDA